MANWTQPTKNTDEATLETKHSTEWDIRNRYGVGWMYNQKDIFYNMADLYYNTFGLPTIYSYQTKH